MKKMNLNTILPVSLFARKQWLLGQGLSKHTIDNWLKSGRIDNCGRGVYKRPELPLEYQGVLSSFVNMNEIVVYLGGVSALEQQGFGHYIASKPKYYVYSDIIEPSWFKGLLPKVLLEWVPTKQIWGGSLEELGLKKIKWREDIPSYYMASVEQAYLELLYSVPNQFSFEFADQIMEGLTTLSPEKMKKLLLCCKSIKTKRLFFWFAKRHQHSWLKYINQKDFELGSGKRVIAKDGALDKDLLITVPRELHG